MLNFWLSQICLLFILFAVSYGLGLLVIKKGVKVNYTRKVIPFVLMFGGYALYDVFPYQASILTAACSAGMFMVWMGCLSVPIRRRISFLDTCFASIDRPEDRPYTLLWFSTQTVVAYAVYLGLLLWLQDYGLTFLINITVIVSGIGDSLAEPVGVRFGRRKYKTKAIFVSREYTRSYVGSACVFLSAIAGIVYVQDSLSAAAFWAAMLVLPPVFTLVEAKSPHTWDQPFIILVGGLMTVSLIELTPYLERVF